MHGSTIFASNSGKSATGPEKQMFDVFLYIGTPVLEAMICMTSEQR
jgi:hypothetical protein